MKIADSGTVTLDGGAPLGFGDPDGWRMNGESELELLGAACTRLKSGDHTLKVVFPCGGLLR